MNVIVETGSGDNPDANSYIALTSAETFHSGSIYATEWSNADPAKKTKALISATRLIDINCKFRGYRKLITQPLEWPRVRAKNDDYWASLAMEYTGGALVSLPYYDDSTIPPVLAQATAQVALELLQADRSKDSDTKGLSSISLGSGALSISFAPGDRPLPLSDESQRLLSKLVVSFRNYPSGMKRIVRVR